MCGSLQRIMDVSLRTAGDGDERFLRGVFASTRDDITASPLTDDDKRRLLDLQFRAQAGDYEVRFPGADLDVVVVDGEDAGRLWVDRSDTELRLLDIALLPEWRNRGIGKVVLDRLIAEAQEAGLPLRHAVFNGNTGALRFYRRLGFEITEEASAYVFMEWRSGSG